MREAKRARYSVYNVPVSMGQGDHFWLARCFKMISSFLMKGRFDLLHTHGYFADIVGLTTAKFLRIPTISTCHGFIANDARLKFYNMLDRIALRLSDRIITVSEEIRNDLLKYGIKEARIKVILNAVQTDIKKEVLFQNRQEKRQFYNFSEKDFVLGYIGRLSEEKGAKYLLEAASMLKKSGLPVKVLIIGDGPSKKELADAVKETRIESDIVFAGFRNDVEGWIPALDVFVLPSLTEGAPMSLLEAMACMIPVVASAVGGVPQIIDSEKEGILVSPGKPEEIATGITTLYNNDSLRENFVRAAYKKVKSNFDIKEWTKKIEAEYLKVIKDHLQKSW